MPHQPRTGGPTSGPSRSWRPTRFVILFAGCILAGFGLLFTPPVQSADAGFSQALVKISHALIVRCGGHALVEGPVLRAPTGSFGVEMKDGCNGANVTILLISAMLAFPASWKLRALGFRGGSLIIQSLNIVRFISLFYIGQYSLFWFDFAHGDFWESLLLLDTMVVFWVWANRVCRAGNAANASR